MQRITKIRTFDGAEHTNQTEAKRHLDKLYGDELTKLAHQLVKLDAKYGPTTEFIDANLDAFARLLEIKADLALTSDEEEE